MVRCVFVFEAGRLPYMWAWRERLTLEPTTCIDVGRWGLLGVRILQ